MKKSQGEKIGRGRQLWTWQEGPKVLLEVRMTMKMMVAMTIMMMTKRV